MTEEEIIKEAMKRAEKDAITKYGPIVATKKAREQLDWMNQQILINFLLNRGQYWLTQLLPQIVGVTLKEKNISIPLVRLD